MALAASGSSATLWGLVPQVNSAGSNVWARCMPIPWGPAEHSRIFGILAPATTVPARRQPDGLPRHSQSPRWQMEQSTFRQCAP